ncbi:TPA: class II aldolase, partial [Yersinia enterocolitica]|nr:class II aldolase [Yersinia enterocolitica]
MSKMTDDLRNSVITYCAKLGEDPLLIQGAGGNVSWKEDGILWVKASGTWLAEALEKDIFVPVDLAHMQEVLNEGDFTSPPVVCGNSQLRPSIETQLHALMSHRVVVHVHSVVALVHLVCDGWFEYFQSSLGDTIPWTAVSYKKPGAELAEAVFSALHKTKDAKVIFLQNHGVVIGGNDVADIEQTLDIIINSLSPALKSPPADFHEVKSIQNDISSLYSPISDSNIHELAINPEFFSRINTCWALYPDHVVFLGARPNIFK